jgi:hypothetical protein
LLIALEVSFHYGRKGIAEESSSHHGSHEAKRETGRGQEKDILKDPPQETYS